ncbi:motile sperm domain-containing protein 1-like isoform X1 [Epinephelus fuscoguttatus]|uniref:motile sperm domain-containing protein 1-like isoform X1 n=1 Tax=Epinephelus fuscoguttatus TaxID=293821 RepID=UPI0020D06CAF|nr:motile sperm domain-containing protein 1-like isoform X1 [Epinephelus fuscoguttatus]XP_049424318.1 motile sperm domain-containing protein 1-like isoform X1 [Epinephelus fuscoguttatus]XP_049424319.1 motile sperm domain-containing protein 1-like isoform X1 [Epinephelus fuscoguttatus]
MRTKDSHDGRGRGGTTEQGGRRGDRGQVAVRQAGMGETGGVSPLPVFLFPSELVFYCEQRSSHRRVLTLYNPYSFSLSFKMLCTAPSLYRVVEAEGSVRAKSCVDLVVRHLDVSPGNWGRRDRFRLEVRGGGQVGGREIWAELRGGGGEEKGGGVEEEEERRRRKQRGEERRTGGQQRALSALSPLLVPTHTHLQLPTCTGVRSLSQWVVCVVVGVLCVAVLMLPLHTESSSVVPLCLHVSTNLKLVCAYTLGLLTMVFLR